MQWLCVWAICLPNPEEELLATVSRHCSILGVFGSTWLLSPFMLWTTFAELDTALPCCMHAAFLSCSCPISAWPRVCPISSRTHQTSTTRQQSERAKLGLRGKINARRALFIHTMPTHSMRRLPSIHPSPSAHTRHTARLPGARECGVLASSSRAKQARSRWLALSCLLELLPPLRRHQQRPHALLLPTTPSHPHRTHTGNSHSCFLLARRVSYQLLAFLRKSRHSSQPPPPTAVAGKVSLAKQSSNKTKPQKKHVPHIHHQPTGAPPRRPLPLLHPSLCQPRDLVPDSQQPSPLRPPPRSRTATIRHEK